VCVVGNKPERVADLLAEIEEAKRHGLTPAAAASLRGKLQYAEGQTFGRCGSAALAVLADKRALAKGPSGELRSALEWAASFLLHAPPRRIEARASGPLVLLFTDGSFEGGVARCGGFLVSVPRTCPSSSGSSCLTRSWRGGRPEARSTSSRRPNSYLSSSPGVRGRLASSRARGSCTTSTTRGYAKRSSRVAPGRSRQGASSLSVRLSSPCRAPMFGTGGSRLPAFRPMSPPGLGADLRGSPPP
jgi:hypothetical protein